MNAKVASLRGGLATSAPRAPAIAVTASPRPAPARPTVGGLEDERPSVIAARAAARTKAARVAQEARDRAIVITLSVAFLVTALGFGWFRIDSARQESKAKEGMQQTFTHVFTRQSEFHSLFGRFATWPELRARGVAVGPRQRVREWNADASHWFLSISDQESGIICDRTGELFDEDVTERTPVCRPMR